MAEETAYKSSLLFIDVISDESTDPWSDQQDSCTEANIVQMGYRDKTNIRSFKEVVAER